MVVLVPVVFHRLHIYNPLYVFHMQSYTKECRDV